MTDAPAPGLPALPPDDEQGLHSARLELIPILREHATPLFPVLDDVALHGFMGGEPPHDATLPRSPGPTMIVSLATDLVVVPRPALTPRSPPGHGRGDPRRPPMLAVLLLVFAAFCGYGFLASFEPMEGVSALAWKIGYGVLGLGALLLSIKRFGSAREQD